LAPQTSAKAEANATRLIKKVILNMKAVQDVLKKKKKITSFGQPTSLIARGRASATLPNVIY